MPSPVPRLCSVPTKYFIAFLVFLFIPIERCFNIKLTHGSCKDISVIRKYIWCGPIIFKYIRVQVMYVPRLRGEENPNKVNWMPSLNHQTFMTQPDPRTWKDSRRMNTNSTEIIFSKLNFSRILLEFLFNQFTLHIFLHLEIHQMKK